MGYGGYGLEARGYRLELVIKWILSGYTRLAAVKAAPKAPTI